VRHRCTLTQSPGGECGRRACEGEVRYGDVGHAARNVTNGVDDPESRLGGATMLSLGVVALPTESSATPT